MQGYKPNAQRAKKKPQGGRIVGPGTGTSDSIQKEVADGSYIMPADSTEAIGEQALEGMGGDVPVNVSNGEFEMPPEQVHAVGVQALDQMKNATHTPTAKGFNPQINRDGEQFFNQGGQVLDEEEAKRKAAQVYGQAPMGIGLTPQQIEANRRADQRMAGAQTIQQTKQNIGEKVDAVGGAVGMAWDTVKQYPKAGKEFVQNTTFDNRLPGQADRDAKRAVADKARASQWAATNPEQARQAGLGIQGVADRATAGANIPPSPLPGVGGYDPAPQVDPQQAAAAQAQAAVDPAQAQVDPAQFAGMANNITRVGNSFSAQGPINQGYTVNGQAQGQTNVAQAPQSAQNQQAVANLFDRTPEFGSGSGVSGYQPQQQGMGTRVTVVRDPTRMPSNAEIMNQRMESAQLRNADAARKTDIEGRRADLGILDQQAQNAIRQQQLGISERNQLLGERKFEIDQQSQGYNLRSMQRLEQAYEALQNAKTPEDKMVALENLSAVRGDRDSNQNLSNNFMKIKVPAFDAEGRPIGEREELVDLRNQGQGQQMPPIGENPAAMQIKNNTKLSREEKQQQLRALGYQ